MSSIITSLYNYIAGATETREEFIQELRVCEAIEDEFVRTWLLINFGASLTDNEIRTMIDDLASGNLRYVWPEAMALVVAWFMSKATEHRQVIIEGIKSGLKTLMDGPAKFGESSFARVALPLMYWSLGEELDRESANVFLFGMHTLFVDSNTSGTLREQLLTQIVPLVYSVTPSVFKQVFEYGQESNLNTVRVLSRVLTGALIQ